MARIRLEEGDFGTWLAVATRPKPKKEWLEECYEMADSRGYRHPFRRGSRRSDADIVAFLTMRDRLPERHESELFQTDWDYPSLAATFGWRIGGRPGKRKCPHDGTDGTVTCKDCGKTAGEFISEANEYLREHVGKVVDDPGYLG